MTEEPRLRLYSDLAVWWPLMSPPSHHVEEAQDLGEGWDCHAA